MVTVPLPLADPAEYVEARDGLGHGRDIRLALDAVLARDGEHLDRRGVIESRHRGEGQHRYLDMTAGQVGLRGRAAPG